MEKLSYAILGGGGSFGLWAAKHLLQQGHTVYGIGRNPLREHPAFNLHITEYAKYQYRAFHTTYELDLLMRFLDEVQPEVIVNFAAQGEGAVSWNDSWRFFETNSMGLVRLVEQLNTRDWMHRTRSRFIQIGTSEMYGSVSSPVNEDARIKPSSPYAASKVAFDLYLLSMGKGKPNPLPFTILRPSNAYCPGQLLHRIIPRTILSALTGRKIDLHGGGVVQKSYIHAADLAQAIQLVAEHQSAEGHVYNIGPDLPISILSVVRKCIEQVQDRWPAGTAPIFDDVVRVVPERPGQDGCYWLDSTAIKKLGWKQMVEIDPGIGMVVDWAIQYLPYLKTVSPDYVFRG